MTDFLSEGLWTLGCLIGTAMGLAMLEEYFRTIWKSKPTAENPAERTAVRGVNLIVSPRRTYDLIEQIATGDLCDVYRARADELESLLKITRVPGGEQLLAKEFSILTELHEHSIGQIYHNYFPKPVESFSQNGQYINAYAWRDGFYTAEQIFDRHHRGLDARHLGWMFNRLLEALGYVHQQGFIHGAVLPPHVLFHAESHGLLLAGWIHAERANASLKLAPERYRNWYPPECQRKHPATPSVDIYLAAKTLIYLAGGDPVRSIFPEHVPPKLQRFVKGCLLESPSMRPQDAWELRQEFGQVLEGLFGPPAFHVLDMS